MQKIKLTSGTILTATFMELADGILSMSFADKTVEELAILFNDKSNTSRIMILTDEEEEVGFEAGFTSFAGITYDGNGVKTVRLFQPADATEVRISQAESAANAAIEAAQKANAATKELETLNATLTETLDSILTDIIPSLSV